ncbi:craniofacial development protein 2-like [Eupeodes corollae]|uniref:craniofacial development protein 2-like n=1 Tax=Eupeodes corollae TaxID=290404 RepID=UPI002492DBCC|nr:craniofacial development protein 2-like [Eupeodes corollae]
MLTTPSLPQTQPTTQSRAACRCPRRNQSIDKPSSRCDGMGQAVGRLKAVISTLGSVYSTRGSAYLDVVLLKLSGSDERVTTIRIKATFHHLSLISAHAPTEEKDENTKEEFYELLSKTCEQCPKNDVKILLGYFNAEIGREGIFGRSIGRHSLNDITSGNGLRLVDFLAEKNMVLSSTRFSRPDIHKGPWRSPDDRKCNQIDHVATRIDGRHSSSILGVRT